MVYLVFLLIFIKWGGSSYWIIDNGSKSCIFLVVYYFFVGGNDWLVIYLI